MTDMTHLSGRAARDADTPGDGTVADHWGGPRIPAHFPVLTDAHASEYARLVAEGGTEGAAWAYLSKLRHEAPDWLDPWRLCEAVAGHLVRRGQ
jgi:hypothetical protein